ncbi:MAG TPA: ATP-binding protein [Myxococcota bacterium]|nr:ATP-binding protein [Myxococcota bacterium]
MIIVDDEPVILDMLVSLFGDSHEVVACATGQEAIAAIADGVDVLLTDKNLPDVNGLDLLDRARARQADAEVLIITGFASLDTALAALQRGAFDYIVKPPRSVFDVQRKVEQAFQRQAMRRENQRLLDELSRRNQELEAALADVRKTHAELVQAEKLAGIGTLAAGIAHEIRSPLFGVMGLAEAILVEDDPKLVRDYAKEIVEHSRTINEIVSQLTGYSRSAEREYLTTVDALGVATDAVRLVVRSTGFDERRVAVRGQPGLLVHARTSELQQVLVNLVKNAVEALEEHRSDGSIEVAVEGEEGAVVFRVSDDGPGIPEEVRKDIFDPFFTTKPPGKGTGLGLNIVWRLVSRYQGTVSVESRVGEGTTFTVRLPRDVGG